MNLLHALHSALEYAYEVEGNEQAGNVTDEQVIAFVSNKVDNGDVPSDHEIADTENIDDWVAELYMFIEE